MATFALFCEDTLVKTSVHPEPLCIDEEPTVDGGPTAVIFSPVVFTSDVGGPQFLGFQATYANETVTMSAVNGLVSASWIPGPVVTPKQAFALLGGVGSFRADYVATSWLSSRTGVDDTGSLTIYQQDVLDTGTLACLGHTSVANARVQLRSVTGDVQGTVWSQFAAQFTTTVVGPFGTISPSFVLMESDHGGGSVILRSWSESSGPHALGSYINGSSGHSSIDAYGIGARPSNAGTIDIFKGHMLAHVWWNKGSAGPSFTAPQTQAIQAVFNAPGSVLERVTNTVDHMITLLGSQVKLAVIFTPGATPLVGAPVTTEGTVTYSAP